MSFQSFQIAVLVAIAVSILLVVADELYIRVAGRRLLKQQDGVGGSAAGQMGNTLCQKIIQNITLFASRKHVDVFLIFLFSSIVYYMFNNHAYVVYNNFNWFADALLNGRLDMPNLPGHLEFILFENKKYLPLGPGPTLFVLPFVAIFGRDVFNPAYSCLALGSFTVPIFYTLLKRIGLESLRSRLWITALFGFGSVQFFCTSVAHSWFFSHVSCTFLTVSALCLAFGRYSGRKAMGMACLAGLSWGFAVTCRMPLVFACPLFLYLVYRHSLKEERRRNILAFLIGAGVPAILYMLFNYFRFHSITDWGYNNNISIFFKDLPGAFHVSFIPYKIHTLFFMGPDFDGKAFPYFKPSLAGLALTFSTPAFFYAVKAQADAKLKAILWITVIAVATPFLMYFVNGMAQFGVRYSSDFAPFLFVLTALALKNVTVYNKTVIAYCILVNTWGTLFWSFQR